MLGLSHLTGRMLPRPFTCLYDKRTKYIYSGREGNAPEQVQAYFFKGPLQVDGLGRLIPSDKLYIPSRNMMMEQMGCSPTFYSVKITGVEVPSALLERVIRLKNGNAEKEMMKRACADIWHYIFSDKKFHAIETEKTPLFLLTDRREKMLLLTNHKVEEVVHPTLHTSTGC